VERFQESDGFGWGREGEQRTCKTADRNDGKERVADRPERDEQDQPVKERYRKAHASCSIRDDGQCESRQPGGMGERVLVTGVSGFVGSAVALALAKRGMDVRGIARSTSSRTNLDDFPGELVTGDLLDPDAVSRAMRNVRFLFHVAADYRLWAPDPE